MSATFEDLRVLRSAEEIADSIWKFVVQWDEFAKDVIGKQMARSADSVGANIAESFGRFNFGEKLQFLYYSRGSIFETKYWLNRTRVRGLMKSDEVQEYVNRLMDLAPHLNTFANSLKSQRKDTKPQSKSIRELNEGYLVESVPEHPIALFTDAELDWLESQSPVSNF